MRIAAVMILAFATPSFAELIPRQDVAFQTQAFRSLWGEDLVWKFDALPTQGAVAQERLPYSGYIYPDQAGGTAHALRKYDAAFHHGRPRAANYERWDTTAFQEPVTTRSGLFGLPITRMGTPHWHGHCNGWAAAAIRHAEPQKRVVRNGVVFSPSDIKALLAEIYLYNDTLDLSGSSRLINAGLLHVVLANWMGRGGHALGMESHPGREKWNYPVYGFNTDSAKRSARRVEVKVNLAWAKDTPREYDKGPLNGKLSQFHYMLHLNAKGDVVGGYYFADSERIDMLWLPLRPKRSREKGNERGNPHVDVERVLAIWRDSVPAATRESWAIADPAPQDRVQVSLDTERLTPLQGPQESSPAEDARSTDAAATAD